MKSDIESDRCHLPSFVSCFLLPLGRAKHTALWNSRRKSISSPLAHLFHQARLLDYEETERGSIRAREKERESESEWGEVPSNITIAADTKDIPVKRIVYQCGWICRLWCGYEAKSQLFLTHTHTRKICEVFCHFLCLLAPTVFYLVDFFLHHNHNMLHLTERSKFFSICLFVHVRTGRLFNISDFLLLLLLLLFIFLVFCAAFFLACATYAVRTSHSILYLPFISWTRNEIRIAHIDTFR